MKTRPMLITSVFFEIESSKKRRIEARNVVFRPNLQNKKLSLPIFHNDVVKTDDTLRRPGIRWIHNTGLFLWLNLFYVLVDTFDSDHFSFGFRKRIYYSAQQRRYGERI